MDDKNAGERKYTHDKTSPALVSENRYCEKLKILKIRIVMTSGKAYVGEFFLPEIKRRLLDSFNDEKLFIALKDVHIEGSHHHGTIHFVALNKTQIVSVEDLTVTETKKSDKEEKEEFES